MHIADGKLLPAERQTAIRIQCRSPSAAWLAIHFMLDEQANELRYVSNIGSEERELIRKIDELKQYVYDMNMSCKSLYKALKSFK